MTVVGLPEATDHLRFGGKAAGLAEAIAAGLRVPPGIAVSVEGAPEAEVLGALRTAGLGEERLAVRSSAVDEDSHSDSFAGMLLSIMDVPIEEVAAAIDRVRGSARSAQARAYHEMRMLRREPQVGIVIQRLVAGDVSGVLFTRDPVDGRHELVVEAALGLGERVVSGAVTPAGYRLDPHGRLLSHRPAAHGVDPRLDADVLAEIARLGQRCDELHPEGSDVEWAYAFGNLWVLQRRPITTAGDLRRGSGEQTGRGRR